MNIQVHWTYECGHKYMPTEENPRYPHWSEFIEVVNKTSEEKCTDCKELDKEIELEKEKQAENNEHALDVYSRLMSEMSREMMDARECDNQILSNELERTNRTYMFLYADKVIKLETRKAETYSKGRIPRNVVVGTLSPAPRYFWIFEELVLHLISPENHSHEIPELTLDKCQKWSNIMHEIVALKDNWGNTVENMNADLGKEFSKIEGGLMKIWQSIVQADG